MICACNCPRLGSRFKWKDNEYKVLSIVYDLFTDEPYMTIINEDPSSNKILLISLSKWFTILDDIKIVNSSSSDNN